MNKPEKKTISHYDYYECERYIAHKLEIESLSDVLGKFTDGYHEDREYQDFWHVVLEQNDRACINGSYIDISDDCSYPDWAKPIAKAFIEEFGEKYWVEW